MNRSCPGTSTRASRHVAEVERGEAQVDGDPALLLGGQPVGVDAGQGADQGRLAVVDVPGGPEDQVARSAMNAPPALARRTGGRAAPPARDRHAHHCTAGRRAWRGRASDGPAFESRDVRVARPDTVPRGSRRRSLAIRTDSQSTRTPRRRPRRAVVEFPTRARHGHRVRQWGRLSGPPRLPRHSIRQDRKHVVNCAFFIDSGCDVGGHAS